MIHNRKRGRRSAVLKSAYKREPVPYETEFGAPVMLKSILTRAKKDKKKRASTRVLRVEALDWQITLTLIEFQEGCIFGAEGVQ